MNDELAPIAVVTHPSKAFNQWASGRRRHYPGVCAADVGPVSRASTEMVWEAITDGLGKDPDLTTLKAAVASVANGWLAVGDTDEVWLIDAQNINPVPLAEVISQLSLLGVRCRLLLSSINGDRTAPALQAHLRLVEVERGDVIDEATLRDEFPNVSRPPRTPAPTIGRLPRVDGMVFRSTCRELLEPEHFATVDAVFVELVRTLRAETLTVALKNKTRNIQRLFRNRLQATPDTDSFVITVRAAQVAYLTCGIHVRVNTSLMLGAEHALPRAGRAAVENWWVEFDRYRDPIFGAVAAIYSYGSDTIDMPAITIGDVSEPDADGNVTVIVAGEPIVIPPPAARFVTAQAAFGRHRAGDDAVPLFSTHRANIIRASYAARLLTASASELGFVVAQAPVRTVKLDAPEWLQRYGIRMEKLHHEPLSTEDAA